MLVCRLSSSMIDGDLILEEIDRIRREHPQYTNDALVGLLRHFERYTRRLQNERRKQVVYEIGKKYPDSELCPECGGMFLMEMHEGYNAEGETKKIKHCLECGSIIISPIDSDET